MQNFDFKRYTPRPKKLLQASLTHQDGLGVVLPLLSDGKIFTRKLKLCGEAEMVLASFQNQPLVSVLPEGN